MRLKYDKNKKKQSTVLYESSIFYKDMNLDNTPSSPARKSKGKVLDDLHKRVKEKILGLDREEWEIFRFDEDIVSENPREYVQNELYDLNKTDARRILKMLTPKKMDSTKSVVPPENPTGGGVFANISSNYSKMCRDNGMCSSLGK